MTKKLLTSIAILFCFTLSITAQDTWTRSEDTGFGNIWDEYITGLIPFKGNLYAGSGNSTGGIFRTSTGNYGSWINIYSNPVAYTYDAFATTTEGGGYIYASSFSFGSDTSRVLRSFDGVTWSNYYTIGNEPLDFIVPYKGLGSVDSMYVIENNFAGAKILRSDYASNDPTNTFGSWQTSLDFNLLSPSTLVKSTLVHSGRFYIGTTNGAQLWSTNDGYNWAMNDSVGFGFGDGNNTEITALEAFGGYIYAGTSNPMGAQLWRTPDQLNWTLVRTYSLTDKITDLHATGSELWISAKSNTGNGATIERTTDGSIFTISNNDGFGSNDNQGERGTFSVFGNNMYYGVRNYYALAMAGPGGTAMRGGPMSTGGQIWRTCLIAPPTINLGNDTTICAGTSITLDAGAGATAYNWSTSATTQTISALAYNGSIAIYSCQTTTASGCDAYDEIAISALISPTISIFNPPAGAYTCLGDSIIVGATAASGLVVVQSAFPKITHDTIDGSLGDNFDTLAVAGVPGSCACTSLISVTIDSLEHNYLGDVVIGLYSPTGAYTDLVVSGYGSGSAAGYIGTEFRMDVTNNLNSGFPPYTGIFAPDGNFGSFLGTPNGNWVLKVGDTYPSGDNGNLLGWTLKFGYLDTIMTFSWTPTTGLSSSTVLAPVITPTTNTDYAVTVTNAIGCPVSDTIHVMVPSLEIAPTNPVVCYGSSTSLMANGASLGYWSPATFLSGTTGGIVNTSASVNIEYFCTDTIGGCVVMDSVDVIANPQVFLTAPTPSTICYADTASLTAVGSGGTPGYTYNWNDGSSNIAGQTINVSLTTGTSYTITATDANGCIATDFTSVAVTPSTDVYGHVSYSGGNVTNGSVVAYKYIPTYTYFDTVQVTSLNTSGDYIFTSLNSGDYLIKVFADTLTYPTLNPTYFGNEWAWDSATVFVHGCSIIDTADVVMIEEIGTGTGPGMLTGTIREGAGFGSALMVNNGFMRAPGDPIPGLDVKLGKNPGGAMVASGTTGTTGVYTFTGIDLNTTGESYTVYVDIPGLGRDSTYSVTLTSTTNQVYYLDYIVDSVAIYIVPNAGVGISNPDVAEENKFGVYPNPSSGNSSIEYTLEKDANVSLGIYNVLGEKISEFVNQNQKAGVYKYSTSDKNLVSGIYFITLIADGKSSTQRLIITE